MGTGVSTVTSEPNEVRLLRQHGSADETGSALLGPLLARPFVPTELSEPSLEDQHAGAVEALRAQILSRLAQKVAGMTRGGKLKVLQLWNENILYAYVVERRGKGLLVQADDVQAWLPAQKVHVLSEDAISIPDWLLRRREGEFFVLDCREGRRPRLTWNSDEGGYHG